MFGDQKNCHVVVPFALQHAGFVLELVDQFGHPLDLDARLAAAGLLGLEHLQPRLDVGAVVGGVFSSSGFFLAFMMLGNEA